MSRTPLTADELRPFKQQALQFVHFAREQNASELKANVSLDDEPYVTYLVERVSVATQEDIDQDRDPTGVVENVTVKRGRGSGQQVLFAGPVSWLEA